LPKQNCEQSASFRKGLSTVFVLTNAANPAAQKDISPRVSGYELLFKANL